MNDRPRMATREELNREVAEIIKETNKEYKLWKEFEKSHSNLLIEKKVNEYCKRIFWIFVGLIIGFLLSFLVYK